MNKDLNSLEVFLLSILTGVFIAVVYAITSRGSYQLSPVQTLLGFLIFTGWAYILYYSYLTKAGKRIRQEYMDRQLQKAIPPKPQPATPKPQDQSLSIPRLQSELKIVQEKIKLARMSSDRQLESDLRQQEQHLRTQIQKIQVFVITRGFRR
jgi:hypothetical protein